MENTFASLSLKEHKKFSFTMNEVTVKTKLSSNDYKVHIPNEIIEFISDDENFTRESYSIIDEDKLKNTLFSTLEEGEGKLNSHIDLTKNPYIIDKMILKAIFGFLGSVNEKNDFTQFTSDDYLSNIEKENFIESFGEKTFTNYLNANIPIIFSTFKMKDLEPFTKAIKFLGVDLEKNSLNNTSTINPILTSIKKFVMAKNKLLVVITPSNNFWIKSEKITIGTKNYDKKINNYSMIFYNWNLIQKFYDRLGSHPRLTIGFLNSMVKKNLQPCIDAIPIGVKNFTKYVLFDQDSHDNTHPTGKPNFVRNLDKMKSKCKHYEDGNFNESNMVILESEHDKISESSKNNSLNMNVFSEQYMTFTPEESLEFDLKTEKILSYLEKMLNEVEGDIREYLATHTFN
jgi:hypothetical protein